LDPVAVDVGAVGGAEVLDVIVVAGAEDAGMATADGWVVEADGAVVLTANGRRLAVAGELTAGRLSREQDECRHENTGGSRPNRVTSLTLLYPTGRRHASVAPKPSLPSRVRLGRR